MDITFNCLHCNQELAVDAAAAGQIIQCPTCNAEITVPAPNVTQVHTGAIASSAAAKAERHFSVPVRDAPSEVLVARAVKKDEDVGDGMRKIRLRVIRHTDCIELGHDRYEELVGGFLNKVGENNIVSITPLNYTHIDIATQKVLTDYAVQIIYRG
jgi:phage FluMu protein Com